MTQTPTGSCTRGEFLTLLSAVLKDTGTTLPEINTVTAVPDWPGSGHHGLLPLGRPQR